MGLLIGMRTATITDKGQIAIPKDMREINGFEEGDKVAIITYNDHIELRPLDQVRKKLDFTKEGIQTAVLSEKSLAKIWLTKEEDEAWKNL
ncbi:AbrB/MazE/SpoVT family DNA-binding domain-containing protein [Candidatus Woesearchaeota archaeon]|nr:AbrB/MazE/SpoVT family DNA-binding domain-containing protein [Candidatus Woesearchaeota archaeon]